MKHRRYFQIFRSDEADQRMKKAQKAVYGEEREGTVTDTILFALLFLGKYYAYIREHHPDFQNEEK